MKTIFIIMTIMMLTPLAFAKQSSPSLNSAPALPATAKILFEDNTDISHDEMPKEFQRCSKMANIIRDKGKSGVASLFLIPYWEVPEKLEYECEKVVHQYTVHRNNTPGYKGYYDTYINLKIICVPRQLVSKQLHTAANNCEKNPQEFCWSEAFLQRLEAYKATEYSEVWNGSCTQSDSKNK